mgnify:CR=1 FL=1
MKTRRSTAVPDTIAGSNLFQRCVHVFAAASLFLASTVSMASAQQAEPQIVVDPHAGGPEPTLDKTQNGIDQVNIATPNAAGVSHNDFLEYGVPERGVILNNATTASETKIGGVVYGNENLHDHAASLILNEVTGNLPTLMLGYTEVAGHQASVVVANPNGITCAGCGFINTARVTLATGTPEMDATGHLKDIAVRGGTITFEGEEIKLNDPRNFLDAGMAFVSEDRRGVGLLLDESLEWNIAFTAMQVQEKFLKKYLGGLVQWRDQQQIEEETNSYVKQLEIRCVSTKQKAKELSGGNQQKVCLAKAFAVNPKLLFVSEPTRGIDVGAKSLVLNALRKYNEESGTTIVMISSELEELRSICDRIAIISDGKVFGTLPATAPSAEFGLLMVGQTSAHAQGGEV